MQSPAKRQYEGKINTGKRVCPLCDRSHAEILALMAEDKAIRRSPSGSPFAEGERPARQEAQR